MLRYLMLYIVCNLALSDENKLLIAQSDVLTPLVSLAQSPDIEVSRQACGALANIAEDVEAHPNMVYEQSMHFLVFLMRSRHLDVHREATRAVANLLSSRENHAVFLEEDGLKSLFRIAKSLDSECEYHAALCFRKLSPNVETHRGIIGNGGLQPVSIFKRIIFPPPNLFHCLLHGLSYLKHPNKSFF